MRGENSSFVSCLVGKPGTSPRARGKPMKIQVVSSQRRNIPACAGKTHKSHLGALMVEEHPRVRGENLIGPYSLSLTRGTSPRARGKPYVKTPTPKADRNIPACAGKTRVWWEGALGKKEHPRVRGENGLSQSLLNTKGGTSPRARGKHACSACS